MPHKSSLTPTYLAATESASIRYWLDNTIVNRAENTKTGYTTSFLQFCQFHQVLPDEILRQRKHNVQSADGKIRLHVENMVRQYDADLQSRGRAAATRRRVQAAINSFFNAHDLPLRLQPADLPRGDSRDVKAASKTEIQAVLKFAGPRLRAAIYLLKDTGMRTSDLVTLNVGDLDLDAEYPQLLLITKKYGIQQATFLGPEAQAVLTDYLMYRRQGTEKIPPENLHANTPLFRQNRPGLRRLKAHNLVSEFSRLKNAANLNITLHSLRRTFETALEAAGVHGNWIDRMIGHKLVMSRGSYSKPTDEQLREAYIKAYDFLRVDEPVFEHERLTKLEEERQREHGERQHLAEKVLRVVDDNLTMKERLQAVEAENAKLQRRLAFVEQVLRDSYDQRLEELGGDPAAS